MINWPSSLKEIFTWGLADVNDAELTYYSYDGWGRRLSLSGPDTARYLWQAKEWDAAITMYNSRARLYDQRVGRFIRRDPFRAATNRYIWPKNAPTFILDPSGMQACGTPGHVCIHRLPAMPTTPIAPTPVMVMPAPTPVMAAAATAPTPVMTVTPTAPTPVVMAAAVVPQPIAIIPMIQAAPTAAAAPPPVAPPPPPALKPVIPAPPRDLSTTAASPNLQVGTAGTPMDVQAVPPGYEVLANCLGDWPPRACCRLSRTEFCQFCVTPPPPIASYVGCKRTPSGCSGIVWNHAVGGLKDIKGKVVKQCDPCYLTWKMYNRLSNVGALTLRRFPYKVILSLPGWSGYPGCGPESQCVRCLGPAPEGNRLAGAGDTRHPRGWFWYHEHTWAMTVSGPFCAGRGDILIHGGESKDSRGCIVLSKKWNRITALKAAMEKQQCVYPVDLYINYTVPSEGNCSTAEIPTDTCVGERCADPESCKGRHTCNVGCAHTVLGTPTKAECSCGG